MACSNCAATDSSSARHKTSPLEQRLTNCSAMAWTMGDERELLRLQRTRAASTTATAACPNIALELPVASAALAVDAVAVTADADIAVDIENEGKIAEGENVSESDPICSLTGTSCNLPLFSHDSFTMIVDAELTNCSSGERL